MTDSLAAPGLVSISYGMIVGGIPRMFSTLGGSTALENGRFAVEILLPGTYRVYARSTQGMVAEADVEVKRGEVSEVLLEP